jgi:P27 family predicted phage terminase small subunit
MGRLQPTRLKILRGNPGKRALPKNEVSPPSAHHYPAPKHLKGEARKKWTELVGILSASQVMTLADTETLARYCGLWELWLRYYKSCRAGGDQITLLNPDGSIKYQQTTAAMQTMLKLNQQLLRLEQEFGMTPTGRVGMTPEQRANGDDLDSFIKKGG